MKKEIKTKIKNIVKLAKDRNELLDELGQLDDYKEKIENIRKKYSSKNAKE